MPKLLIVDDDRSYADILQQSMKEEGWVIELAATGADALQLLQNFKFDFILLDWNLPDTTGLDVCKRYRKDGGLSPIVFLTGRHDVQDKESGLDAGADDYLTKPFAVRELKARMRSIQRRPVQVVSGKFLLRDIEFDPRVRSLKRLEEIVQLSPTESSLLETLCKSPDTFFTSSDLLESVWSSEAEASESAVRTHMRVLRKKLELFQAADVVQTVLKSGYVVSSKILTAK